MIEAVYILCALTSLLCAALLLRSYGRSRMRLLLWSGLCFLALGLNNIVLFLDMVIFPQMDLSLLRGGLALLGMATLLYGLIWDSQ